MPVTPENMRDHAELLRLMDKACGDNQTSEGTARILDNASAQIDAMASECEGLRAGNKSLADEVRKMRAYDGCDGCSTGDCPHDSVNECVQAQAKLIAELSRWEASYESGTVPHLVTMIRTESASQVLDYINIMGEPGDIERLARWLRWLINDHGHLRESQKELESSSKT